MAKAIKLSDELKQMREHMVTLNTGGHHGKLNTGLESAN